MLLGVLPIHNRIANREVKERTASGRNGLRIYPGRIDIILTLKLLELEPRVRRIAPKQPIRPPGREMSLLQFRHASKISK